MSIVLQKGDMELKIYKFNLKGNNGAEACNSLAVKDSMILMLQTNWFHYIDIKPCLTRSPNGLYLLTALQDRKISIPIKTNPKSICTLIVSNVQVNNKYFAVGNQSLRLGNCACTSSEWKLANFIYIWQQFSTKEKKDEENKHWPSSYYEIQEILIDYLQPEQKPTHQS